MRVEQRTLIVAPDKTVLQVGPQGRLLVADDLLRYKWELLKASRAVPNPNSYSSRRHEQSLTLKLTLQGIPSTSHAAGMITGFPAHPPGRLQEWNDTVNFVTDAERKKQKMKELIDKVSAA